MALNNTVSHLKDLLNRITHDIGKAEGGNKAAAQRVRTMTVKLEKTAKTYRKESIANEKSTKGHKKPSKKAAKPAAKKHAAPKAKHAAPKHAAKKPAAKAKPKAKAAVSRPRALSFKRPTARLPVKRAGLR